MTQAYPCVFPMNGIRKREDLMTEVIKNGAILDKRSGEVLEKEKKLYIPAR